MSYVMCVCICVCERKRDRDRDRGSTCKKIATTYDIGEKPPSKCENTENTSTTNLSILFDSRFSIHCSDNISHMHNTLV